MRAVAYAALFFAGIAFLRPHDVAAQTGGAGPSAGSGPQAPASTPKDLAVAPQAPPNTAQEASTQAQPALGPANICRELVAYLQPKPAPPGAGQPAHNPASSTGDPSAQASGQPAPVPQTT